MYRIAICDDEPIWTERIQECVRHIFDDAHIECMIDVFHDSDEIMERIEEQRSYDIYLFDVEMPNYNGMKLTRALRRHASQATVMLVTAYLEYAIDAFELSVFRYIPKTDLENRLNRAFQDLFALEESKTNQSYVICNSRRFERIAHAEISYIYKHQKNTVFVCTDGTETSIRKTMAEVYKELADETFIYLDRCYIINVRNVKKITGNQIQFVNGASLVVGISHIGKVKQYISEYWAKRV